MGADYKGQEAGIEAVQALPKEGKEYLSHHLNNSMAILINMLYLGKTKDAEEIVWHMVADLNRVGIGSGSGRPTTESSVNYDTSEKSF